MTPGAGGWDGRVILVLRTFPEFVQSSVQNLVEAGSAVHVWLWSSKGTLTTPLKFKLQPFHLLSTKPFRFQVRFALGAILKNSRARADWLTFEHLHSVVWCILENVSHGKTSPGHFGHFKLLINVPNSVVSWQRVHLHMKSLLFSSLASLWGVPISSFKEEFKKNCAN